MRKLYPILLLILLFFILETFYYVGDAFIFVIFIAGFLFPIYVVSTKDLNTNWSSLIVPRNLIYIITSMIFLFAALIFLINL